MCLNAEILITIISIVLTALISFWVSGYHNWMNAKREEYDKHRERFENLFEESESFFGNNVNYLSAQLEIYKGILNGTNFTKKDINGTNSFLKPQFSYRIRMMMSLYFKELDVEFLQVLRAWSRADKMNNAIFRAFKFEEENFNYAEQIKLLDNNLELFINKRKEFSEMLIEKSGKIGERPTKFKMRNFIRWPKL